MSECLPPAPVVFVYATWATLFPALAAYINQDQATAYFSLAVFYLDNTPCSAVTDSTPGGRRATILNLLTAHVAILMSATPGPGGTTIPVSPLVGRITNATEGSVSVQTDMGAVSPNAAWYQQTQPGAMAWTMLAPYRTARYFPGPRPYLGVGGFGRYGGGFWSR